MLSHCDLLSKLPLHYLTYTIYLLNLHAYFRTMDGGSMDGSIDGSSNIDESSKKMRIKRGVNHIYDGLLSLLVNPHITSRIPKPVLSKAISLLEQSPPNDDLYYIISIAHHIHHPSPTTLSILR